MGTRPVRVLGFPVTVEPGFLAFTALLVTVNLADVRYGAALAVTFAVFTLVHELGHALAARRFAADTTITLGFLVGLASVEPRRPLRRWERAVVTAAGPLTAVTLGLVVLAFAGRPLGALVSGGDDRFAAAVRWTGVALGVLNLLPLTPLDGGNLLTLAIEPAWPTRARAVVQWWSVAVCAIAAAAIATHPRWVLWAVSVGLLAAWNIHGLRVAGRAARLRRSTGESAAAAAAERAAWSGDAAMVFPDGWVASPWLRARDRLLRGDEAGARRMLVRALSAPSGAWALPSGATTDELHALAVLVPPDAAVDQLHAAWALQSVLHEVGLLRRAADYGAAVHARHRAPEVAHQVARSLALLGDASGAVAWLREAHGTSTDASALDDPELDSLRNDPAFVALRAELTTRGRAVSHELGGVPPTRS